MYQNEKCAEYQELVPYLANITPGKRWRRKKNA